MPSSDYSNAVGGGLKLKGAGGGGVDKKKKKKKAKKPTEKENEKEDGAREEGQEDVKQDDGQSTALQKALAEEEKTTGKDSDAAETEVREYGKTEAQRRFEERRKKRVCYLPVYTYTHTTYTPAYFGDGEKVGGSLLIVLLVG